MRRNGIALGGAQLIAELSTGRDGTGRDGTGRDGFQPLNIKCDEQLSTFAF